MTIDSVIVSPSNNFHLQDMTPKDPNDSWNIELLAEKANAALAQNEPAEASYLDDSRMAKELTVRNLRRLVALGAVDAPSRQGREAYYGPKHLEQVLSTRELMAKGFTSSSIQALRAASSETPSASNSIDWSESKLESSADVQASNSPRGPRGPRANPMPSTSAAMSFLNQVAPSGASAIAPQSSAAASRLSIDFPKAYQALSPTASGRSASAASSQASFETEPFSGVRITVRASAVGGPLTAEQRKSAIEALEEAWRQAQAFKMRTDPSP